MEESISTNFNRRTFYNLLRINWMDDSLGEVEAWKVEDYRTLSFDALFEELQRFGLDLEQHSFIAYAENVGSPEELTFLLLEDQDLDPEEEDRAYLAIFELWRRLVPEKLSLSIFCDEIDHQILLFDEGDPACAETIQDVVANLQMILDENVDLGVSPAEIYGAVCAGCANNLESFLYDYISEQVECDQLGYATEMLEGLQAYVQGSQWFDLLNARILAETEEEEAQELLRKIVQKAIKGEDLAFNLETLSIVAQLGERKELVQLVKKTLPLIHTEDAFQDLLAICNDYYRYIDDDQKESALQKMIDRREGKPEDVAFSSKDPDAVSLLQIVR